MNSKPCSLALLFAVFLSGTVLAQPCVTVTFPNGMCVPATAQFEDCTADPHQIINWILYTPSGQVDLGSDSLVVYSITSPGTYIIYLAVEIGSSPLGVTDTFVLAPPPVINSVMTLNSQGCTPFENCYLADVTATAPFSYLWDFCDSATYTTAIPCHTFADTGCYCATLVITDAMGCVADMTIPDLFCAIDLNADFIADVTYAACPPLSVQFTNLTPSTSGISTFWDFGDAGPLGDSAIAFRTYNEPGCYDVTMIVSDTECKDTVFKPCYIEVGGPFAEITASVDNDCGPATVCFILDSTDAVTQLWCPDNGMPCETGGMDTMCFDYDSVGVYNPTLLICDVNGCCYEKSLPPVYIDSVVADIAWSVGMLCGPGAVQFSNSVYAASGSFDAHWDFGDGNTSTLPTPSHLYTDTGCYNLTFVATGPGGCTDTIVVTNAVCVMQDAIAEITSSAPSSCSPPLTVCFYHSDANVSGTVYDWSFIGGTPVSSSADSPCVVYNNPGAFDVTLLATAPNGCTDTAVSYNFVDIGQATATVFASDSVANVGDTLIFTSTLGTAHFWSIVTLTDTMDLGPSTNQQEFVFPEPGTYSVCVEVSIPGGCLAEDCVEIVINDTLQATNPAAAYHDTMRLQPNPADGVVVIEILSEMVANGSIEVLTVTGEKTLSSTHRFHQGVNILSMDVSSLSNGVYFLRLQSNALTTTRKLVIQR